MMANEQSAAKALLHVTTAVLHAVNVVTIVLHHVKAVANVAMTVALHVVSAVTTALHHARAVNAVMTVVLHAKVVRAASLLARVVLRVANHLTARAMASVRLHTRMISNHCVAARETINDNLINGLKLK